jgi:hypothetical protein
VSAFWLLCLVAAIAACVAGAWRSWYVAHEVDQPIAAVGLQPAIYVDPTIEDPRLVSAATQSVESAGLTGPAYVVAVDGRALPAGADLDQVAASLKGPAGPVRVTFGFPKGAATLTLQRGAEVAALASGGVSPDLDFWIGNSASISAAIVLLACAVLLFVRRRGEPVALLIAFALVIGAAAIQATSLWVWLGLGAVDTVLSSIFFVPLIVALPAFPDGEYRSRVAGWFVLAGTVLALTPLVLPLSDASKTSIGTAPTLVAALFPIVRFRRTPPGIERQQLKWAGLGVFTALVVGSVAGALVLAAGYGLFSPTTTPYVSVGAMSVFYLAFIALAGGLTVALMRFALWDADKAIGKSAAFGILSMGLGGTWAACAILANDLATNLFGQTNKAAVAAASTVVAAAVIAPARNKVNGWVEKRFQATVVALRGVSDQILAWQASDTPGDVGRRVIVAITSALRVSGAALAVFENGSYRAVASRGLDPATVDNWLTKVAEPVERVAFDDPVFVYRFPLLDIDEPLGLLLLTARAGGAGLAGDEIAGIEGLRRPLSAALRLAHRREQRERRYEQRDQRYEDVIAALRERLAALEGAPAGRGDVTSVTSSSV